MLSLNAWRGKRVIDGFGNWLVRVNPSWSVIVSRNPDLYKINVWCQTTCTGYRVSVTVELTDDNPPTHTSRDAGWFDLGGMWEGEKNGAVYWNVFVVSSRPGYSAFHTSPIITDQHTAGYINHTTFFLLYIVILCQPTLYCTKWCPIPREDWFEKAPLPSYLRYYI